MSLTPVAIATALLSALVTDPAPWLHPAANSEQRGPVYLGATPAELQRGVNLHAPLVLRSELRQSGEHRLKTLSRKLSRSRFEVEAWPYRDDQGRVVWEIPRWREAKGSPWQWLDQPLRPWVPAESEQIFTDFLKLPDLYAKPSFGNCVWTSEDGAHASSSWLPPESAESFDQKTREVCHVVPPPARFNGKAQSFVLRVEGDHVTWPAEMEWRSSEFPAPDSVGRAPVVRTWPADFNESFRESVLTLSGPRFERKNSADPGNQLADVASYFEERYARLGIRTRRQKFTWRGISQQNVIAILPGDLPPELDRPVLMADHYDTAFCEDEFARTGRRISAPGADDNATASAALLEAGRVLRDLPRRNSIWLVHFTGEEFPADDLGARRLVSELLSRKQEISGLVLMDMIGFHRSGDTLFQVSAGGSEASLQIASEALDASRQLAEPAFHAALRTRFDARSYLYNTDGLVFSDAGFPVILLNEHLNALENLNRAGYHQTTDTWEKVDFGMASTIARVAIETAARLAQ